MEALHEIGDPKIALHVVGDSSSVELRNALRRYAKARVVQHANWSFDDLPWLLSAADCVPLLQDAEHAISQYQIPSKLSDATSLGIPVLVTDVPSIRDLRELPGVHLTSPETLKATILKLKSEREQLDKASIRAGFLSELSESVNRARLRLAISEISATKPVPEIFQSVREVVKAAYGSAVATRQKASFPTPALSKAAKATNIAFFWKQNDTGLYGRRSDMIAKHLLQSGEIDRILFFDAPISIDRVKGLAGKAAVSPQSQSAGVLRNTIARWERELDDGRLLQRSFIYGNEGTTNLLDRRLPDEKDFADFVASEMREAGFDPSNTIAWVCPVVWPFPDICERMGFRACVADIIDDQRSWDIDPGYRRKLDEFYKKTLSLADLAFANCEPVAAGFQDYAKSQICVVPNGAERFDKIASQIPAISGLNRPDCPTIGYVGNLRDRIDWPLLSELAQRRPEWTFVFAGAAEDNENVQSLAKFANVKFVDVVEYQNLPSFLKSIDVAIVPHVINELTNTMNPLKAYNYLAAGLPIVSTAVSNLSEIESFINVAHDAEAFISSIDTCLANGLPNGEAARRRAHLDKISWETRVSAILRHLEPFLLKNSVG